MKALLARCVCVTCLPATIVCVSPLVFNQLNSKDVDMEKGVAFTLRHYQSASETEIAYLRYTVMVQRDY